MVSPPTRSGKNALEVLLLEGLSIPTLTARDAGRRGDHGRQGAAAQGTVTAGMAAANVAATGCKFSVRMRHPFSPKMCHGLRPEPLAARGRSGGGGGCSEPWHAARSTIYGSAA